MTGPLDHPDSKHQFVEKLLRDLSSQHQSLIQLVEQPGEQNAFPEVQQFLEKLAHSGTYVVDAQQRSHIRALIRFWSSFIYDRTGEFPDVQLFPRDYRALEEESQAAVRQSGAVHLDVEPVEAREEPVRGRAPPKRDDKALEQKWLARVRRQLPDE